MHWILSYLQHSISLILKSLLFLGEKSCCLCFSVIVTIFKFKAVLHAVIKSCSSALRPLRFHQTPEWHKCPKFTEPWALQQTCRAIFSVSWHWKEYRCWTTCREPSLLQWFIYEKLMARLRTVRVFVCSRAVVCSLMGLNEHISQLENHFLVWLGVVAPF